MSPSELRYEGTSSENKAKIDFNQEVVSCLEETEQGPLGAAVREREEV